MTCGISTQVCSEGDAPAPHLDYLLLYTAQCVSAISPSFTVSSHYLYGSSKYSKEKCDGSVLLSGAGGRHSWAPEEGPDMKCSVYKLQQTNKQTNVQTLRLLHVYMTLAKQKLNLLWTTTAMRSHTNAKPLTCSYPPFLLALQQQKASH